MDAFFVLSGLPDHESLLAEWEQTGRIALGTFWGRRARRLLPALLLMVAVVTLGARTLLPPEEVRLLRGDGLAALFYVANWRMILRGGDYFAQTASPSPLEHTWSLGIEEQFYLVWPLLMARPTRRGRVAVARSSCRARRALIAAVRHRSRGVDRAAWRRCTEPRTRAGPTTAPTPGAQACWSVLGLRSYSLGVGRIAAGVAGAGDPSRSRRLCSACCAALAVLCPRLGVDATRSGETPGCIAAAWLLVAVAVAVVLAHVVLVPRGWSARVLAVAPLVLVGRISYGIYLWHWPMFIAVEQPSGPGCRASSCSCCDAWSPSRWPRCPTCWSSAPSAKEAPSSPRGSPAGELAGSPRSQCWWS